METAAVDRGSELALAVVMFVAFAVPGVVSLVDFGVASVAPAAAPLSVGQAVSVVVGIASVADVDIVAAGDGTAVAAVAFVDEFVGEIAVAIEAVVAGL